MKRLLLILAGMMLLSSPVMAENNIFMVPMGGPDWSAFSSDIIPAVDNTYNLGSATKEWKGLHVDGTTNLDDVNIDGTLSVTGADPAFTLIPNTAVDTRFWFGNISDNDGVDDDKYQIGTGTTPGTNPKLTMDKDGNVGINTSTPVDGKLVVKSTTNDGSTYPLVIEDSDASNIFEVNSDGDIISTVGFRHASVTAGITAVNPGAQGDGALTSEMNEVSTVGAIDDAVTLPSAAAGRIVRIANNGANQLEIWPASGDNAGGGVDTAVTLAAGSNVTYVTYDATNWEQF